jgi:LPS-assembly protein
MISRSHWIITAVAACHLLAVHPLVTSQSLPPCAPPESQEESTICAQQQEKDGTIYKLRGNARIFYRSYILSADEVTYDSESGASTAEGHVVLEGGANDEHIEATRGEYNVQTEFGSFYNVAGTTGLRPRGRNVKLISDNPFAFSGKLVEKRGPGRFVVHDGTITTCPLPQPKWAFHAVRVSVEAAGEARIYNSSFWVHGVPILYLPFATHPLTKEPHESGFLIPHFGRSSRKGAVIGAGYFWAINRSVDLTLSGEYYSQRGGSQNANFRWRPSDSAFLDLTYFGVIDENGFGGEDAHLNGEGQLPWGFRAVADIEYLSQYAFRSAFSPTFSQAVDSEVKSKIFVSRNSGGFSYNAEVARYQNFQSTNPGDVVTILHTPGFEVSGVDHHLGNTPLLFSVDGAAEALSRSEPTFRTANLVGRFDFHPSLALPLHWQGWSLRPQLGLRETFYTQQLLPVLPGQSANVATDNALNRKALEVSLDLRPPSIERVFADDVLGRKLKHVIEPSLTYRYVTGINNFGSVLRFDVRDILSNTHEVEYGVTQRLYAKGGKPRQDEECRDNEGLPVFGVQGETRSAKHPWQKEDARARPCPKGPEIREIVTWRIGQKYFLDSKFGGALVDGQRNVLETSASFTGIAFLSDERRWSPLISRLRVQTTAQSEAEWNLDYDFKKGRVTSSEAIVNYHFGNVTVGGSDNFLHTPSVISDSGSAELSQFHQFRALLGYGSPSKRGLSAMSNVGVDANALDLKSGLQYASLQSTYNWDCCGVSLGYRRFALLSVKRVENEYFFQFNLANIASFGNLRRQERLF